MNTIKHLARRLAVEEQGGEVVEYTLLLGLIALVIIFAARSAGTKINGVWKSIDTALDFNNYWY